MENNLLDKIGENKIWVSCWEKGNKKHIEEQWMTNGFFGASPKLISRRREFQNFEKRMPPWNSTYKS